MPQKHTVQNLASSPVGLQTDQVPAVFIHFNLEYLVCPPSTAATYQGLNLFCCLVHFLFYLDGLHVYFLF